MEYQNQTNQIASNDTYQGYENSINYCPKKDSYNSLETPPILVKRGYQYIELLGEGSNGKTFKARNRKTGEIVAIKALKFSDNLKNYELFEREAKALQQINVKGVPKYYDYISQEREFTECWLVQEYIEGDSLLDLLEKGTHFDELEILLIMRELTRIVHDLQTFYAPPIIHRDIKPSNILIQRVDDQIKVNLIDFGAVANPQKRFGGSTVAGTVGYMAPEQLIGDCTLQSDYYSIGATALHLFTVCMPSELQSDGFELHYEELLKSKVPDIHPKTLVLLKKLLAPQAQDRPKDTAEIHQLINDAFKGLYQSGSRARRRKMRRSGVVRIFGKFLEFIFTILWRWCLAGAGIFLFGLIISLFDKWRNFEFMITALFVSIAFGILFFGLSILGSRIEDSSNNSSEAYQEAKDAAILSPRLDEEMKAKKALTTQNNSNNVVEGKVMSVFPDGIEFIFTMKDQTYSGYQSGKFEQSVGDTLQVFTKNRGWFGGIKAWIE